jgi:hypothetical protein
MGMELALKAILYYGDELEKLRENRVMDVKGVSSY